MDINELKNMLKHSTAVLIMDNGDPSFVVLDFSTYKRMLEAENGHSEQAGNGLSIPSPSKTQSSETELLERINKDILALKEQIEEEEKTLGMQE